MIVSMSDTYEQLADYIKNMLRVHGWSQRTLASRSGISHDTISRLAKGKGPFDVDTLEKVSTALGVSADHIKHLAGIIEKRNIVISDPDALDIAITLDTLPEIHRQVLVPSVRQMIRTYMQGASLISETKNMRPNVVENHEETKEEKVAKGEGQKKFVSEFANQVSRVGSIENTTVDLSIFPEGDREIISQLDPAFQEYLTALLKQGEDRYLEAMNYARSGVDAEMKRIQRSENTLKNS